MLLSQIAKYIIIVFWGFLAFISAHPLDYAKPKLSDYNFFKEPMSKQISMDSILSYRIPTPLFTDYAFKSRFMVLPKGERIYYVSEDKFDFPVGTIFIKTFYYPSDFRVPDDNWKIIETRLLVHTPEGWSGYPYIWNNEQTDAFLEIAGGRQNVSWVDNKGVTQSVNYRIPNFNMCKDCHVIDNIFQPIGPKPRIINYDNTYEGTSQNQLEKMIEWNMVDNVPKLESIPITAEWNNDQYTLNDRARSYLDMNCAHCHNSQGPANTSGLFLEYHEKNRKKLGVLIPPVAAGRGSGGLSFNIVPGKPN